MPIFNFNILMWNGQDKWYIAYNQWKKVNIPLRTIGLLKFSPRFRDILLKFASDIQARTWKINFGEGFKHIHNHNKL